MRPLTNAMACIIRTPVLPLLWFAQVQLLGRAIGCDKGEEDIAVLSGLGRWSRRFVFDDVFEVVFRLRI